MSFKEYISKNKDLKTFTKEQQLVLITGQEFENSNYVLKNNNNTDLFKDFKSKENRFSYDFIKGDITINLNIQNRKDGNFEISICNDLRSTSEEIKLDNYLKNNSQDYSSLEKYIQERIKNIEKDNLFNEEREYRVPPKINNNIDTDNLNFKVIKNNNFGNDDFIRNPIPRENNLERNFANIGYDDLHGNLPNFVPGYDNSFGRPKGNLMGPDAFRGPAGFGGINYDPITPFGPKFDFIPQYDGPMKKPGGMNGDIDLGFPGGNKFGFGNNFGDRFGGGFGGGFAGGFNTFI